MKKLRFFASALYGFITRSGSFFSTLFVIIASVVIASWLMLSTFSYNTITDTMKISSKVWSDFGAHIPLIRSFSLGDNLTRLSHGTMPEYPLFPGAPIRYHFLFYMGAGILERLGVRIDWALNSLSIIGFGAMLIAVYFVAKHLFHDWRVGILAWVFTLANGSLTFLKFFATRPLTPQTFVNLWNLDDFLSFAPWGKGDISAFWSLNIFTNQRHLGFAFAIFFLFLLTLMTSEHLKRNQQYMRILPWGVVCGFLPFFHQPTFIVLGVACLWYIIVFPKLRIPLLAMGVITAAIAIPQLTLLTGGQSNLAVSVGYLMDKPITIISFLSYWWDNIGGHLILIPLGFLLSPKRVKKYLFPAFLFFALGFSFQFSRELAANHKFFNLFFIMGSILSAYMMTRIIDGIKRIKFIPIRIPLFVIPIGLFIFLILSGVVDFMPIKNDRIMDLRDVGANANAAWFLKNTPPDAVVLNASFFLHPASLAGRKIFLGWPYFAWSAGYDTVGRLKNDIRSMYNPEDIGSLCRFIRADNISFVTFEDAHMEETNFNETLYQTSFPLVYASGDNSFRVYDVRGGCTSSQ